MTSPQLIVACFSQFFFALPVYGLEQLYARFGDSASLVRPARANKEATPLKDASGELSLASTAIPSARNQGKAAAVTEVANQQDKQPAPVEAEGRAQPSEPSGTSASSGPSELEDLDASAQIGASEQAAHPASANGRCEPDAQTNMDTLASSMSKLAFVPTSLRFGRGKGSKFASKPRPTPKAQAAASSRGT